MASMRRLRRRLLRWSRWSRGSAPYTYDPSPARRKISPGHWKAWSAVQAERARRDPYAGYGPCFCVGCIGHGRCEHDDVEDEHDDAWDDEYEDDEPAMRVETTLAFQDAGML